MLSLDHMEHPSLPLAQLGKSTRDAVLSDTSARASSSSDRLRSSHDTLAKGERVSRTSPEVAANVDLSHTLSLLLRHAPLLLSRAMPSSNIAERDRWPPSFDS